jgi:hypothetical protein
MSNISSALVNVSQYRFPRISYSSLQAAATEILQRFYGTFNARLNRLGYLSVGSETGTGFVNEQGQHLGGASFVHSVGGITVDPGVNSKWLVLVLKEDHNVSTVLADQLVVSGDTLEVVGSSATASGISLHTGSVVIGVVIHDSLADVLIEDGIRHV